MVEHICVGFKHNVYNYIKSHYHFQSLSHSFDNFDS